MSGKVAFTEDAARRIAAATLAYERGNRDMPPIRFRQGGGDDGPQFRVGRTTATWPKGSLANIAIYEAGTPPNETTSSATVEDVVNHWADVASGKWVGIQLAANGHWYLVVAEC